MERSDESVNVAEYVEGLRLSPNWVGWRLVNVHQAIVPFMMTHEAYVQLRLDEVQAYDLTIRHPMGCGCDEAKGAPVVQPPVSE